MGYTGNKNLISFQNNTNLVKITSAGLTESHVHSISITRESQIINLTNEGYNTNCRFWFSSYKTNC